MAKPDHNQINNEIIATLDVPAEYHELGVRLAGDRDSANASGWVPCHAVDREDATPSAAINLHTGRYKDHGGDGVSLSLWDFATQFGQHENWETARRSYAKKAGVKLGRSKPKANPADSLLFQAWNDILIALWCGKKPGVTPDAVRAAGGRLARYPAKNPQYLVIALPVFGPHRNDADPVGWVAWNSNGQQLPKFNRQGKVTGMVKMKAMYGSESGVMGLHGVLRLGDGNRDEECVWLVAGPTDMLALWAIVPPEQRDTHLVVANSGGENENVQSGIASLFAGRHVRLVRDNDPTGVIAAKKWCLALEPIVASVRSVQVPVDANDLREWITQP
jgi:hypothetical protein